MCTPTIKLQYNRVKLLEGSSDPGFKRIEEAGNSTKIVNLLRKTSPGFYSSKDERTKAIAKFHKMSKKEFVARDDKKVLVDGYFVDQTKKAIKLLSKYFDTEKGTWLCFYLIAINSNPTHRKI